VGFLTWIVAGVRSWKESFLICWLGFKLLAARRKSAKLKSMVLEEVLFQFRPLKFIQTGILGLLAGTMSLALSSSFSRFVDFTALVSADLGAFGVARAIYINFPTCRIYNGAHPAFSLELLSGALLTSMVVHNLEMKVESAGRNADPEDVTRLVSLLELRGDVQKADDLKSRSIGLLLFVPFAFASNT